VSSDSGAACDARVSIRSRIDRLVT
jgi:hypothetical protein